MPRKVFVAGEILTAADVNTNLMDQAVMVFDSSAARGSAIPTPSEGMVTYLKDIDELQKFDGSAFVSIAPSFLTATSTFSGVSSVSINNCFSADFTNYRFVANLTGSDTGGVQVSVKMRASGTDDSTNYSGVSHYGTSSAISRETRSASTAGAFFTVLGNRNAGVDGVFYRPFQAAATNITDTFTAFATSNFFAGINGSEHNVSSACDGFSVIPASGTMSGTIRVYGIEE